MDLNQEPKLSDLKVSLDTTFIFLMELRDFVFQEYPNASEELHRSG